MMDYGFKTVYLKLWAGLPSQGGKDVTTAATGKEYGYIPIRLRVIDYYTATLDAPIRFRTSTAGITISAYSVSLDPMPGSTIMECPVNTCTTVEGGLYTIDSITIDLLDDITIKEFHLEHEDYLWYGKAALALHGTIRRIKHFLTWLISLPQRPC